MITYSLNRLLALLWLATLVFCAASYNAYAAYKARFPDDASLSSPNGCYTILNVSNNRASSHTLIFKDKSKRSKKYFYSYDRNVEVLWSPDSKAFIINDNAGSNVAYTILFCVHDLSKHIDLGHKTASLIRDTKDIRSLKNDHVYFNTYKWISPSKIQLAITGHGDNDPDGFTLIYEYDLHSSIYRIKRIEEEIHKY